MIDQPKVGMVCRHHSGRVYTIRGFSNTSSTNPKFPVVIEYLGANGEPWSRPLDEWRQNFTVIFDGTQYACTDDEIAKLKDEIENLKDELVDFRALYARCDPCG